MSSVINTNIKSLIAQQALNTNNRGLSKAMEQLSTGKRINSAADDAAGNAIASKMTAQIRGLNQAVRNANDGISMVQTAEGATQEITNMLQRMRELAVQSANATNSTGDRANLDSEFQQLGAEFKYDDKQDIYYVEKPSEGLKGTYIHLDEISVTGTANVVMAAVLAKGKTTIYNAACEPYVQQLCRMLSRMGARIEGIGSNLLHIEGVEQLGGTEHRCLPDMIEIGSFIGLAAMTGGDITIKNAGVDHLGIIPHTFERLGITIERKGDDLHIPPHEHYEINTFIDGSILTIYDAPWPGFTPDLMSIVQMSSTVN